MALRGTLHHRKTRRLAKLLGIPPCCALGVLEALWHVTSDQAPEGDIGRLSNVDIADEIMWDGDPDALIEALIEAKFLDKCPRRRLTIHNWLQRCDQATKRKVYRRGQPTASNDETQLDVTSHDYSPEPVPVPEPVPDPSLATDVAGRVGLRANGTNPRAFEPVWLEFQSQYPKRDGALEKAKGRTVLQKVLSSGVPWDDIHRGLLKFKHWADATGKTGTSYVPQMPTWLNGKRWLEDYETPVESNGKPPPKTRTADEIARMVR